MADRKRLTMFDLMTEDQFEDQLIGLGHLHRWMVACFRPALTGKGWRTPMKGDRGYPDLTFARRGQLLVVEVKSEKGKLGEGQPEWAREIGPVHYRLWKPSMIEEIKKELQ